MKRITERDRYGKAIMTNYGSIEDMIERLADYEDTELEPDCIVELADDNLSMMKELKRYSRFSPGQQFYVIERNDDGIAQDISGYMFLSISVDAVIASVYIDDIDDIYGILEEHVFRTRENFDTNLCVFPLSDCYETYEKAEAAMQRECGNVYEET